MQRVEPEVMSDGLPDLEWTGERYLPWIRNATISYEHLHRYAFAARFAQGKRVLDLGSGEGYGSSILARTASSVLGVDIDCESIQHASAKYPKENLTFSVGSFAHVPSADHVFDLIVCFEAIEHIENQHELLSEVKRLLAPDGLFLVSTPNKTAYRTESEEKNQFHVNELEPAEFEELLRQYFREITFLGQRIHSGSGIWPLKQAQSNFIEEIAVEHIASEFEFIANDRRVPIYIIGIASNSSSAVTDIAGSVLIDNSDELIHDIEDAIREQWKHLGSNAVVTRMRQDLDWHVEKVGELDQTIAKAISDLQLTQDRLVHATRELETIHGSRFWKLLNTAWHVRDSIFPPGSNRRRLLQRIVNSADFFSHRQNR